MRYVFLIIFFLFSGIVLSQKKKNVTKKNSANVIKKFDDLDYVKINDSVAALIPFKMEGKFGYKNQKGKVLIEPIYSNVGFFTEDCNILNSPNNKVKKFGSADYASVRVNDVDFRIDRKGKIVYQFKDADLGKCENGFKKQLFHGYMKSGFYGIIEDAKFQNPEDYRDYQIYPQYQYVHILEGDDLRNPMIIASYNDKFGIIDIHNRIIVPFKYEDIKPNFSWKLARLFEVTKDGENYYFIDNQNKAY